MVNLELYRIFIVVAEEENITKASERLNISQPAVTKHIKNLEEALETTLFERNNKGLKLTEIGNKIYSEINEPLHILENIDAKYGKEQIINMGIHSTMLSKLFSDKMAKYYSSNEKTKINIVNANTDEMIEELRNMQLDLVVTKKVGDFNDLKFISLGKLHDVIVSRDLKPMITLGYLKNNVIYLPRKTSMSTTNFFQSIKENEDITLNVKHITYNTMIEIVKKSDDIGLVTKEYVQEAIDNKEICILDVAFDIAPIEFGIYINTKSTKKLNTIIDSLKQT